MTLKQIIAYFNTFADIHKQVNTFLFGQASNIDNTDHNGVLMWGFVANSNISETELRYSFNISFLDILNNDQSNIDDVLSDTLQIAADFCSWLDRYAETGLEYSFIRSSQLEPVVHKFESDYAGYNFTIDIAIPFNYNKCEIPTSSGGSLPSACDLFLGSLTELQKNCIKEAYLLQVDFTADKTVIHAGESVTFTPNISEADYYYWDFGDGNNSLEESPSHSYLVPGVYNVLFSSFKDNLGGIIEKTAYIQVEEASTPVGISGLIQWLTADDVTIVDGGIDVITDKSGNGNHATATTSVSRATLNASNAAINNQKSLTCNGTGRYIFPLIEIASNYTIVYISKKTNGAPGVGRGSMIHTKISDGARWCGKNIDEHGSPFLFQITPQVSVTYNANAFTETNNWDLMAAVNTGSGTAYARKGNVKTSPVAYSGNASFKTDCLFDYVGFGSAMEYSFIGDIAEIMIYNRELSDAEWDIIQNYTMVKYGI